MPSFVKIVERFAEAGCVLYTTEEEYNNMKNKLAGIFRFKASCTHDNTVTLTNFWYKGTGIKCKDCIKEVVSKKNIINNSNNDCNKQEYEGIVKLSSFIEDEFYIERTNEGCLSDILIKPKYLQDDKWMMVQVKTTQDICHNLYTFSMHDNDYTDCLVLCMCIEDEKIWLFDNSQIIGKKKFNIGVTEKSEYFKCQVKKEDLAESIHNHYALYKKFTKEYGVRPRSVQQQQELFYKRLREKNIPYIDFVYPNVEGRAYDFIVNNYKIQEKVASIVTKKNKKQFYMVCLYRSSKSGKMRDYRCYNKGDNDFYWIWKKDDKDTFYVIPEDALIEREYIQIDGNLDNKKKCFTLAEWTNEYKYSLSDKDLQKKLEGLLGF